MIITTPTITKHPTQGITSNDLPIAVLALPQSTGVLSSEELPIDDDVVEFPSPLPLLARGAKSLCIKDLSVGDFMDEGEGTMGVAGVDSESESDLSVGAVDPVDGTSSTAWPHALQNFAFSVTV